ncbi:hypothetical protein EST38_g2352 [Candolleomyces aberdarensis]|uniref:Uncharacterized protein n=1 Tax=Candolleomyces aberdarensis TaxID=2316362 RepID=A0A4Q2DX20_9AGAR|nr:hypothetical protein EST38_g2352 [Candolleomyces aberdarensis]
MPSDEGFDDASPKALLSSEEVSEMIDNLASDSQEVFDKAIEDLNSVIVNQQDLATKQLLNDVPRLIKVASETTNEERRYSLISLICAIPSMSDQGDATIRANTKDFVSLFKTSASSPDLHYLVSTLEDMLEKDDDAFEGQLVELLETYIYNIPDYDDEAAQHNHRSYVSAIEGFENALVLSRTKFRNAAVKAGALNYLVMTTFSPDKATRLAAVSCLVQAFEGVDELVEHVPDQDKLHLQGWIVIPMLGLLNDDDMEVADAVVKFLYGNDEAVAFFFAHEASIISLLSLYAKEKRVPNANASYCESLISWCSSKDSEAIIDGFRKFWLQDDIELQSKLQVLQNFAGSLLQEEAGKGGAIEFVQEVVQKAETNDGPIQALGAIDRAMFLNIQFGHYLLLADSLPWLLSTIQAEDPKLRSLASSILRHLLRSYRSDHYTSLRNDVAPTLTSQETLSRAISNANDGALTVSGSAFRLLAELLSKDTQDEYLQAVRSVIDEPLVHLAVDRLSEEVSSSAAVEFLSQVLQDESGSSSLVQKVFATRIPTAPAPVFAALYPSAELNDNDSFLNRFESSYQESVALHKAQVQVLEATSKAGAVPRVLELLREPTTTVEARRSAVRATFAVLSVRDVDRDIGRTNKYLPDIVAQLIGDETTESLVAASRLVNLLAEPSAPQPFKTWTALATPQTVEHLSNLLGVQLEEQAQPEEGASSPDDTAPESQSQRKKVSTTKEFELVISKTVLLIKHLLPILAPFSAQLAKASLAGFLIDGKSDMVELMESLPTADIVEAIRSVLSSSKRPPLDRIRQMIASSEDMARAYYAGDIVPFLVSLATDAPESSEEDSQRREVLGEVLAIFKLLVYYHRRKPSPLKDIQAQFFQSSPLVKFSVETITNTEEYGTYTAYTMALDLFKLANGYPEGIALISTPELLKSVIKGFDDPDCTPECITPLLGLIAHVDLGAVGAVLKQQIDQLLVSMAPRQGRKKKQNISRFDKHQVLSRLKILVKSSDPALKQLVLESGGLDVAWCVLAEGGKPDEAWDIALEVITSLLDLSTDGAVSVIVTSVRPKLPTLLSVWNAKTTPKPVLPIILRFLGVIVEHDKPDGPQSVVELGWTKELTKTLSERPAIAGGIEPLVKLVVALARSGEVGQRAVVDTFKEALQSSEALKSERKSGNALAIKHILAEGEDVAGFMVEAGAAEYAVRLLNTSDPRLLTIGASLGAALALTDGPNTLPTLEQLGVGALVEKAREVVQGALASEDSVDEKKLGELRNWDAHLTQCATVLRGESVASFDRLARI